MNLIAIPVGLALLFGGGFMVNEWSHGGMSQALGLGHHHALDYGAQHCASQDGIGHGHQEAPHMHNGSAMPNSGCSDGSNMSGPMGEQDMGGMAR